MTYVLIPFPEGTIPELAVQACEGIAEVAAGYRFCAIIGSSLTRAVVLPAVAE